MEQTFFVFGHHVRPYGKIGGTISKFGRTMSDDRLLFPALVGSQSQEDGINKVTRWSRNKKENKAHFFVHDCFSSLLHGHTLR